MLKTLCAQIKEYKWASIATPVFMLLEVAVDTIIPLLMASIIDNGVNKGDTSHIYIMGVWMIVAALFGLLTGCLGAKYGAKAAMGFGKNLRAAMFRNIQTFSFANIDRFSSASLVTYDNRCDQHPECLHDAASHGYESPCVHNMCDGYVIFHQPSPCDNILNRCHCAWSFTAFHQHGSHEIL